MHTVAIATVYINANNHGIWRLEHAARPVSHSA